MGEEWPSMGEEYPFQQMMLEHSDIHMQKYPYAFRHPYAKKTHLKPYILYK